MKYTTYKQILSLAILMLINTTLQAQFVAKNGSLKVVGTQLTNAHNQPVVLAGVSFGWSCFHPRFYNKSAVKWLANNWKCTVVRASLGVEPENGYLKDAATSMQLITAVIDAAIQQQIYVIVDWHSHNIQLQQSKIFFETIAKKYHQYPNIIYEIFNEPDYETWPEVKAYSTEIIQSIRAIDAKNIILVGSPRWDQDVHLPASDPILGFTNIMYTMHFYAGTHKQWLRDRTDEAMAKGLPIFISESAGMDATGDGKIDEAEWEKYIDWIRKNKLSFITWSLSDKDESCSMLLPSASSFGKWKAKDIKASGTLTKKYLQTFAF